MLFRDHVREAVGAALEKVLGARGEIPLERPESTDHGDLATSVALRRAREAGMSPKALAEELVGALSVDSGFVQKVRIAGPGFINLFMAPAYLHDLARRIAHQGTAGLWPRPGEGLTAQVEFCSANPTGPLSVGRGRGLVLGDTIANLLDAAGYAVTREYYYNDAGRQMRLLGESVLARWREIHGGQPAFPDDGYRGQYITDIARNLSRTGSEHSPPTVQECTHFAEREIFRAIKRTTARLGVSFDVLFNEASLHSDGKVERILRRLDSEGLTFEKDGARWLKGVRLGLGGDRVLVKATGEPTYRLPDLAYHIDKLGRGFDLIVDVLGTDHLDESRDVLAGLKALGEGAERVRVIIHQFVTFMRGGSQVRMSTRKGTFVTLDELIDEVGADVVRYFFLTRSAGSHLPFDLDLAKEESEENPVFYLQYAHARISSVLRRAVAMDVPQEPGTARLELLEQPEELELLRAVCRYPDLTSDLVRNLEPHRLVTYLGELAAAFHLFYHRHRIITEDHQLSAARLTLSLATRALLAEGLGVLGVAVPDRM
jgi:arginyl-tRNA synthetase